MSRTFRQSDTATVCGITAQNGTYSRTGNPSDRLAVDGGAAGSSADSFRHRNTGVSLFAEFAPGQVGWSAGDYVYRANITTAVAGAGATIIAAYVLRVASGCGSPVEVGSVTGLSISCTAGVKTVTIPGGLSTGAATDKCRIEVVTTAGASPVDGQVTPDQLIDTPILPTLSATSASVMDPATASGAGNPTISAAVAASMAPATAAGTAAITAPVLSVLTLSGAAEMGAAGAAASARTVVRGLVNADMAPLTAAASGGSTPLPRGTILHPSHKKVYILT